MSIRKFKPEDAKATSMVMNEAFRIFLVDKMNDFDRISFSPKILKKISCCHSFDSKTISFVAEINGKIVGYIRGSVKTCGLGCLEVVGVSPHILSKGVGTALMKALDKFFVQHKMRKIYTCVSAHNTRALIYYFKNGFIPEGYQKDHFRKGVDEIVLGRFLKY